MQAHIIIVQLMKEKPNIKSLAVCSSEAPDLCIFVTFLSGLH